MSDKSDTGNLSAHIRILMYHHVGPYGRVREQRGLHIDTKQFARQMKYLARSALSVISMDHALKVIAGQASLPGIGVVLTFDDGFQDFHDHAWHILKSYDLPAMLYAVSDRLGGKQDWGTPSPFADNDLMDAPTLRKLSSDGLDVGGHTATHPHLSKLSSNEQTAEIRDAKLRLEDILGQEVRHFAYPYGDYNNSARDHVAAAGYASATTTTRKRAERAESAFEIPRITVSDRDGTVRFWRKTHYRYNKKR